MESPNKKLGRSALPMEQPHNTLPFRVFDEEACCWLILNQIIGASFNGAIEVHQGTYTHEHDDEQEQEESMNFDSPAVFVCSKSTVVDQENSDAFKDLQRRVEINKLVPDHPNILGIHRLFTCEGKLYVTFPFISGGTMRSILAREFMNTAASNGMPAVWVSVVLREILMGLAEIHRRGQVHREISASQIFFGEKPEIRLAFSATVNDYDDDMNGTTHRLTSSSKTGKFLPHSSITKWAAAPEVYYSENSGAANNPKADMWLVGVTALELAFGAINVSNRDDFELILELLYHDSSLGFKPLLERRDGEKRSDVSFHSAYLKACYVKGEVEEFPSYFNKIVLGCLAKDPRQRPSADDLLEFINFQLNDIGVEHFYDYLRGSSYESDGSLNELLDCSIPMRIS